MTFRDVDGRERRTKFITRLNILKFYQLLFRRVVQYFKILLDIYLDAFMPFYSTSAIIFLNFCRSGNNSGK